MANSTLTQADIATTNKLVLRYIDNGDGTFAPAVVPRLLTPADTVTILQGVAASLQATSWLNDGYGNPIASWSPTGGTNLLAVKTADTRLYFVQAAGTVVSAGGNSGDIASAMLRELAVDVNATAIAGAGVLSFFLDRKGNDGIYYPIATLTPTLSAVGSQSYDIGPNLQFNKSLGQTVRLRWTITGTSVTCSMNMWGKT